MIPRLLAAAFLLLGVGRLATTWRVFSQTYDEPAHVACGLEWLSRHTYRIEPQHPPLARVMDALLPWLSGARTTGLPDMFDEGNEYFYSAGPIEDHLAKARAGTVVFYLLGGWTVFLWGSWVLSSPGGAIATGLYSVLPPILAHAGLATTDMAAAATIPLALYAWCRYLEAPGVKRAAAAGFTAALAILTKFTAIPFLFAGGTAIYFLLIFRGGRPKDSLNRIVVTYLLAFLLPVALMYGFSPFSLPLGLYHAGLHIGSGHQSFLFGETRSSGWWYFFPVVISVKTPLPFLLLALAGIGLSFRKNPFARTSGFAALAILVSVLSSSINLGVRHILPIYPLLAVPAAAVLADLWRWQKISAVVPVLWLAANTVQAHPDYLAWFNELGSSHPERILAESDLDWGQDLTRLRDTLRAKNVSSISLAYFGTADPKRHGLPEYRSLERHEKDSGWIAVSMHELMFYPEDYKWLEHVPSELVGKTILLYYVAP